ncbi:MAG: TIGR03087 family PEP-CTERM/XrtA system glycosyltransferase [Rubrivivax sp.]
MADILFLAHRLPYPPDKGDKIRSYHQLRHLVAAKHRVWLGTFVDDEADLQHLPAVEAMCAGTQMLRLHPRRARLKSLRGLATGQALTVDYYRDPRMSDWVAQVCKDVRFDAVLVYSSSMLQYVQHLQDGQHRQDVPRPLVVDFCDVDSAKWHDYGRRHAWPMSWVYRREARLLADVERAGAAHADHSLLATANEAQLFRQVALLEPDRTRDRNGDRTGDRIGVLGNGVDADFHAPDPQRVSPFGADEIPLVFVGAMDYWPNIDAVCWFADQMLPALRLRHPKLRMHIVGRNPAPAVLELAKAHRAVSVTGTVPDVRPYVQHAAVVVAPLRLARGIQNKVLEAMAMARPVVAASACAAAIDALPGQHLLAAEAAQHYIDAVDTLLRDPAGAETIGRAARCQVQAVYGWDARLAELDRCLGLVPAADDSASRGAGLDAGPDPTAEVDVTTAAGTQPHAASHSTPQPA